MVMVVVDVVVMVAVARAVSAPSTLPRPFSLWPASPATGSRTDCTCASTLTGDPPRGPSTVSHAPPSPSPGVSSTAAGGSLEAAAWS